MDVKRTIHIRPRVVPDLASSLAGACSNPSRKTSGKRVAADSRMFAGMTRRPAGWPKQPTASVIWGKRNRSLFIGVERFRSAAQDGAMELDEATADLEERDLAQREASWDATCRCTAPRLATEAMVRTESELGRLEENRVRLATANNTHRRRCGRPRRSTAAPTLAATDVSPQGGSRPHMQAPTPPVKRSTDPHDREPLKGDQMPLRPHQPPRYDP